MSTITKRLLLFTLSVLFLAGCATARAATPTDTPIPANNPYAPQPGDSSLSGDTATYESTGLIQSGKDVQLDISYRLPTPCHQTRVEVAAPDADGRINIKLYSLFEANKPCALMPLSTPLHAMLDLGSFPKGHYTVYVNDTKAVEFDE
jgi:hypothetical protein